MHLLLIEDEEKIATEATAALTDAGFVVRRERDGHSGWISGADHDYAAVILDLGLPALDGWTVLKRWREEGVTTPVLILTARGGWMERVTGIDAGADDYLPKPFHMEELIARVRALIRRSAPRTGSVTKIGNLVIDLQRKRVVNGGRFIPMTASEFRALDILMTRRGRVVTAGEFMEILRDGNNLMSKNAVEALIGRIRRKLGAELIETRRGIGYIVPDRDT